MLNKYLQLEPFLQQPVHLLSKGEQQRTALARALIIKSRFLILDEPFSSLDIQLKQSAISLLKNILEHEPLSILLITHHLDGISSLAQKIFFIKNGRLCEESKIKNKHPSLE